MLTNSSIFDLNGADDDADDADDADDDDDDDDDAGLGDGCLSSCVTNSSNLDFGGVLGLLMGD